MRKISSIVLGCALLYCGAAWATCPTPAGQPVPAEAKPVYLANPSWRARVASIDQALTEVDLSKVRLLFLGDSITEFWDMTEFGKHFGALGALNLGVNGDTTQGLLWRLPHIGLGTTLRPALVVLLIGTNNTYPNGNALSAAIGIGVVVQAIRTLSPDSRILLVSILPRGPDPSDLWRQMGAQVNRLVAACVDAGHVMLADPGPGLLDRGGRLSKTLAADLLHPTPAGYAILSDSLSIDIHKALDFQSKNKADDALVP